MEEPTSILLLDEQAKTGLNIQQPLYSNNTYTKLIETENRLNQVFEEYTGRIESFMLMLDTLKEGILLVNKTGEVCFANEPGNTFIKSLGNSTGQYLAYRNLSTEELIPVNTNTRLRVSNFVWNGEACNIFVVEKEEPVKETIVVNNAVPASGNEPFAHLMDYVRLIAEHEKAGRLEEANQTAELANKTITQGEKLLNEARAYTKLIDYKTTLSQVSMQKVVGDILKSMGPEIEDAGIEISVSELPETTADKDLIIILLKQLISNAVKFRNKSRKAIIDIGHDKSEGQYIFCVRDNGIGISKKHHDEVFDLFTSLNNADEYPGNGMGLAICKKIVELHNGKIWVESLPGHGSNFYFKLNAK